MEKLTTWINEGRGRLTEVARACGITHSAVSQWDRVPSDRVLIVERVSGIPRGELRPDLYGELEAAS
ncbi:Cro/CI family transcriptional regulator [Mesorhizobium sp. M7A.F.Ca.MR.362.00.0.0]|uniref:transcriptional regulator n=1 Tax=Mesorhizobium sp. M7A.F.Ca.MR.362.00.0.0 TaxID=2496779 RepID=UPI000FD60106|nr:Cro/CI family transcriptional regulator [Mesorhizobium sp. M7A.F.Ca.MR.362.00.0.0]RUU79985.1 hypothetical protein EOC06_13820 [Mesorhizobium sp. M7A.F.Ca.MR.362.00.0.0]